MTKDEACQFLKASPRYLEMMVKEGKLSAFRPSRKFWRVSRQNLNDFLTGATTELDKAHGSNGV